jgi:penicillin-binding protein 1A
MTKTYALFPRLGRKVNPIFITKVTDRDGKVLEEAPAQSLPPPTIPAQASPAAVASPMALGTGQKIATLTLPEYPPANDPDQVLDPRVAFVMSHLMKEVVTYGTGHEATNLGRPAAGKTGTTNDYIDAWFMGFTTHVVTGVWVGFDNQKSIGRLETGARAALPIWLSFMREAVKPYPANDFTIPPGVTFATIDATSGKLSSSNSSNSIKEAFIEGTEPTEMSNSPTTGSQNQTDFFKEDTE